ncbi:MAG: ATP-binding protein, partial [Planctomycetia bacterium]|nr:ATP-binding protein [Planctomycetia bacterium]
CRSLARIRLREKKTGPTEPADVEQALTEWVERPKMTPAEERVLATHEAGHAVVALFCPHAPPIDRVTIVSDAQWAFGYVRYDDPAHKYIQTRGFLLDLICVALGAREAEIQLLEDLSVGSTSDLAHATHIAREMVEVLGLGGDSVGVARYRHMNDADRHNQLSQGQLELLDKRVHEILEEQRQRAARIILENRKLVEALRDLLLEKKTIDARTLSEMKTAKK